MNDWVGIKQFRCRMCQDGKIRNQEEMLQNYKNMKQELFNYRGNREIKKISFETQQHFVDLPACETKYHIATLQTPPDWFFFKIFF